MSSPNEHLRTATKLLLVMIYAPEFSLPCSGVILEQGINDRPTGDVDLFATNRPPGAFSAST